MLTFDVTAPILDDATGTISNTASTLAPVYVIDSTLLNNSSTDNDTVLTPSADLEITKTDGVISAVPGTGVVYTIVVTNNGPSQAINAVVTGLVQLDMVRRLQRELDLRQQRRHGGLCAPNGTGDINTTATMKIGSSVTYTVAAPLLLGANGTIVNTANVAAPAGTTDPSPGNKQRQPTTTRC